jgi:hypothetical protein
VLGELDGELEGELLGDELGDRLGDWLGEADGDGLALGLGEGDELVDAELLVELDVLPAELALNATIHPAQE